MKKQMQKTRHTEVTDWTEGQLRQMFEVPFSQFRISPVLIGRGL